MSSDLFAAFGSPPVNADRQKTQQSQDDYFEAPVSGLQAQEAVSAGHNDQQVASQEDDDDFGDFEDATTPAVPTPSSAQPSQEKLINPSARESDVQYTRHETYSEPFTSRVLAKQPIQQEQPSDPGVGQHPFARHMDLLFDAGEDEYDAGADEMGDISTNPEAAVAYSKRLISKQEASRIRQEKAPGAREQVSRPQSKSASPPMSRKQQPQQSQQTSPNKLRKKSGYAPARDANVLFDAENLSEHAESDDEWGDFEDTTKQSTHSAASTQPQQKQGAPPPTAAMDLLSLDDGPPILRTVARDHARPPATEPTPEIIDDEPWDDFEEATQPTDKNPDDVTSADPIPWSGFMLQSISAIGAPTDDPSYQNQLPPTNIPPPLVLLSVFPSYFASTHDLVFEPLSKVDSEQRTVIFSSTPARNFLSGYVNLSKVLGHIIAGRKSRWKRDQYLAQGMRIGPSGGKAGMKLTGLDRTEAVKEDREALDVLRLWKAQVGKARSTVSAANAARAGQEKLSNVAELAEQMPVRAVKGAEGGIMAPHACALCGLKREERVAKVDVEVQDSFGEWWMDGVSMHRLCWDFWSVNRQTLKSR